MNIYLVRHTLPEVAAGICYGRTDLDVASSFEHELLLLKAKLGHLERPLVFSSSLQRCLKLATNIAEHFGIEKVQTDARLLELDFGDWELQKWADIPQGIVAEWTDEHIRQAPPNGESYWDLSQRAKQFLVYLKEGHQPDDVLVFTHAGVIRALVSDILEKPLTEAVNIAVDYGSVTHIVLENGVTRLEFLNA